MREFPERILGSRHQVRRRQRVRLEVRTRRLPTDSVLRDLIVHSVFTTSFRKAIIGSTLAARWTGIYSRRQASEA